MDQQGLSSRECLRIIYNHIDQVLLDFRKENLKTNHFVNFFYKQNKYELIHNTLLLLFSIFSLILSTYFKYLLKEYDNS
jgi:hypothetical protein